VKRFVDVLKQLPVFTGAAARAICVMAETGIACVSEFMLVSA